MRGKPTIGPKGGHPSVSPCGNQRKEYEWYSPNVFPLVKSFTLTVSFVSIPSGCDAFSSVASIAN